MTNIIIQQALLQQQIAMEKVMEMKDRNDSIGRKVLIKILGMVAYIPKLTFDQEDVDMRIVEKMCKHPELLKVIDDWIFTPDQDLVPKLEEARRVFSAIQKPKMHPKLYRGFDVSEIDEDNMLTADKTWYGKLNVNGKPGDKFTHVTKRALSFTHHEGTASSYGKIIATLDPAKYKNRLLDISLELCYALYEVDPSYKDKKPPYYTTYGEYILMPSKEPIEFVIDSIGGNKAA